MYVAKGMFDRVCSNVNQTYFRFGMCECELNKQNKCYH